MAANKRPPTLIHIGKCGGSYLTSKYKGLKQIHMRRPDLKKNYDANFIIILRNPFSRFVSAFNHSKNLLSYDVSGKAFADLFRDPSSPYFGLKQKSLHALSIGNPFGQYKSGSLYRELLDCFDTANHLAESLSSPNSELFDKAQKLVSNCEVEHIAKGIGWYLHNGDFVQKFKDDIIYCSDISMVDDSCLECATGIAPRQRFFSRKSVYGLNDRTLSELAIDNIKKYCLPGDFKALGALARHGLIGNELLREYSQCPSCHFPDN
jgi:hypothetical protein